MFSEEKVVIGSRTRISVLLSSVSLILLLRYGDAGAQQTPAPAAQNPYMMGTEGYEKGPRGLTSYMPIAIDQPFAAQDGTGHRGQARC